MKHRILELEAKLAKARTEIERQARELEGHRVSAGGLMNGMEIIEAKLEAAEAKLAEALGEMESQTHSERRRNSPLWQKIPPEEKP
jgi:predicted  nucleic acid-binding Zn-ribbon protein